MRLVEKNVPMPAETDAPPAGSGRERYPWHLMEVGDSFTADAALGAIQALITYQEKKRGWHFIARQIDAYTVRVWRIV